MRCKAIHLTGEPFACLVAVCRCVDGCEAQSGEEIGNQRVLAGRDILAKHAARALATRPGFILLDEPFAGVDPIAVEDIMRIVAQLRERGIGVLITDHNVHETLAITDRAYLLYDGKIFMEGTAEELAANEEVRRRYLGESFTLDRYQG